MNLRPQERRLVVFVGIVFFVVLNIWLVWPHFGDWTKVSMDRERALRTLIGTPPSKAGSRFTK